MSLNWSGRAICHSYAPRMSSGQLQQAAAAKIMQMDANASADTTKLLDAAQKNFSRLANVATGVGGNLDITA